MIILDINLPNKAYLNQTGIERFIPQFMTMSQIKKGMALQKAQSQYNQALEQYVSYHGFLQFPAPFNWPLNYFVYYNQAVHYVYNRSFSLLDNIATTFKELFNLPYSSDGHIEEKLLLSLKNLIKESSVYPKYQLLLWAYEENYHEEFPLQFFFLYNGNICQWQYGYTPSIPVSYKALSSNLIKTLEPKSKKKYTRILATLKSLKTQNALPPFSYKKAKNPYYFYLRTQENTNLMRVEYHDTDRVFKLYTTNFSSLYTLLFSLDKYPSEYLSKFDISCFFYNTQCQFPILRKQSISEPLVEFLYALSNGNVQNLVKLSILFANIVSPEILTPKLFLITYNNMDQEITMEKYFVGILDHIFNPDKNIHFSESFPTLGKLILKRYIPYMINNFFNGCHILTVPSGSSNLSQAQIKELCKLIRGSKLTAKDNHLGTLTFRNMCPVICFTNNPKEISFLQQNLPCIKINLDFIKKPSDLPAKYLFDFPEICDWIRFYLPLYGLFLMAEKTFHHVPFPKEKYIKSDFLCEDSAYEFIHNCCVLDKNEFIYADMLYNAYKTFYSTVYKSIPPKRVHFVSMLKRLPNLNYKRPHSSRTASNKYAFVGIRLKSDWESCVSSSMQVLSLEEISFKEKLEEITTFLNTN